MADYAEKMLVTLVEKYRKSKKDSGSNVIARRTKITPAQLYKNYNKNDADMEQIEAIHSAARMYSQKGFLTFDTEGFSSEIRAIYLVDEKIEEAEKYLEEHYGYVSKATKRSEAEELIVRYEGRSPAADQICGELRRTLDQNKIPADYQQKENWLKALAFIENNQKELFLREASMLIYGDSKYLENEQILGPVCKRLWKQSERPRMADEMEDEILETYHIRKEKQKLCLKGDATIQIGGEAFKLAVFADGVEFYAENFSQIERIEIHTSRFMTVENRTSWLRMSDPDTTFFYLGGYATRLQRDFLKKVYADNPELSFAHFGDIDAGGLYIHEHLCRITGIPFALYRMSSEELADARFQSCLHTLSAEDRVRLQSLKKQEPYRQLAAYMLENNVKLEQEIISYYESR
ncbi:MAG: DUF2220 domain-containing protein [Lachnospiraceae bacterium]|nr:DUF2220 domain-containing protein [Lachnospiraceae bacterium]